MSETQMTEKQLKKRESNLKYREKLKQRLESVVEPANSDLSCVDNSIEQEKSPQNDITETNAEINETSETHETEAEESFVLDKKTYQYLLEKASQNVSGPPTPKPESPITANKQNDPNTANKPEDPNSFFFQLKSSFRTTAISLIPVLTMQMFVHGSRYLANSRRSSPPSVSSTQSDRQQQLPASTFALPTVNSF